MNALNTHTYSQTTTTPIINNHVTVNTAAEVTGYNLQYLRRLLRSGKLNGVEIGQPVRSCSGNRFPIQVKPGLNARYRNLRAVIIAFVGVKRIN